MDASVDKWLSSKIRGIADTNEEVEDAAKTMKKKGSPGSDGLTIEIILAFGIPFIMILTMFCNQIMSSECLLIQFLHDVIVPIYKKNSVWKASNYRPISLLQMCANFFPSILHKRVEAFLNLFWN